MEGQVLISHSKGKKHIDKMKLLAKVRWEQSALKSFFVFVAKLIPQMCRVLKLPSTESPTVPVLPEDTQAASTSTAGATITKFVQKEDVLVVEVLWAVKTVVLHYSTSSSAKTGNLRFHSAK